LFEELLELCQAGGRTVNVWPGSFSEHWLRRLNVLAIFLELPEIA
jgi:hypothetical protein